MEDPLLILEDKLVKWIQLVICMSLTIFLASFLLILHLSALLLLLPFPSACLARNNRNPFFFLSICSSDTRNLILINFFLCFLISFLSYLLFFHLLSAFHQLKQSSFFLYMLTKTAFLFFLHSWRCGGGGFTWLGKQV